MQPETKRFETAPGLAQCLEAQSPKWAISRARHCALTDDGRYELLDHGQQGSMAAQEDRQSHLGGRRAAR